MKISFNKISVILLLCLGCITFFSTAFGQASDTLQKGYIEFITDQLENIAQQTDRRIDYTDLIEDYLYYSNNPINLNGKNLPKLVELYLINDIQLINIKSYINRYGQLFSVYELKNIPGFDQQTFQNILPFIVVSNINKKEKVTPRKFFNRSKHSFILRYGQVIEPSIGFRIPVDSAIFYPGKTCLGSPQAYYARYAFRFKDKIRIGFTLEKDAGEIVLQKKLNDSIQMLVGKKVSQVFDFFSGHIFLSNMGILEKVVIGDYHLEFGQGLTLWTGMAFGKSAAGTQVKRFGQGIRPNTSANENRFFRGGAFTLKWKHFNVTGFYSQNKADASIQHAAQTDEKWINSMQETGKHRTINELLTRHAIDIIAFGGRMGFQLKKIQIGLTTYKTVLGTPIRNDDAPYKYFGFNDNELMNFGLDFNIALKKINLFGEVSGSQPGGIAGIAGINAFLADRFVITLLYRHYAEDYHNLFNNPFSEAGNQINERGLYLGFSALLSKNLRLTGYVDHFQFPWLKYLVDGPSQGRDYQLQLNYSPSTNYSMYFRFRYRRKQVNWKDHNFYTTRLSEINRNEFRYFISYQLTESLVFKNRIDYVLFRKETGEKDHGYMIYHDILYRPKLFPLDITFRYALFSTDGFDSRIYSYENDVLYAFTVPSYSGNGQRVYLMLRLKVRKKLNFWLRLARTIYADRKSIGSGCDEIEGYRKTELKFQVQLKL